MKAILLSVLALAVAPAAHAASTWILNVEGGPPVLGYGEPESDDYGGPSLICRRAGLVEFMMHLEKRVGRNPDADGRLHGADGRPLVVMVTVASGAVSQTLPARAMAEEMEGGTELYGAFPARSPVLAAILGGGAVRLRAQGETVSGPRVPAAKGARFKAGCKV